MIETAYDQLVASVESARDLASTLDRVLRARASESEVRNLAEDYGIELADVDDFDVSEFLSDNALEIYGNGRVFGDGTHDLREVVVVLGTGGPHIEFTVTDSGRCLAEGYWGSDKVERSEYGLDTLGDFLSEYFGGWS